MEQQQNEEPSEEVVALVNSLKEDYMELGSTLDHVVHKHNTTHKGRSAITRAQLIELVEHQGWDVERKALIAEMRQNTEDGLAVLRATKTVDMVDKLVSTSKVLGDVIDSGLSEIQIQMMNDAKGATVATERLSKAHASNVSVIARILALSAPTQKVEMNHTGDVSFMGGGGPQLPSTMDAAVLKDEVI